MPESEEDDATEHVEAALVRHVVGRFHRRIGRTLNEQVVEAHEGGWDGDFGDQLAALILEINILIYY